MPPMDDAKDITPNAVDRLLLNQWAMMLVIGPYITPHETYKRQQLGEGQSLKARSRARTPTPKP